MELLLREGLAIEERVGKGRCCLATRDISPGELLPVQIPPLLLYGMSVARLGKSQTRWADVEALRPGKDFGDSIGAERAERYLAMSVMAYELCGESLRVPPHEMTTLLSKLETNAFNISDGDLRPIGVGLYPSAALINHSCAPNCCTVFEGSEVFVRCVAPIRAGEELTVAYVDLVLFITNSELVESLNSAFNMAIGTQDFKCANRVCKDVIAAYERLYPMYWPIVGLQYFMKGKLEWYLGKGEKALFWLRRALENLQRSHSDENTVFRSLGDLIEEVRRDVNYKQLSLKH
eukprot:m51a1_g10962 putative set and mynd domain-containing protein 3 (291) ;mRNA; f:221237-222840